MKDKSFKADAKSIVDMCFDTKLFNDDVTRDVMNTFEELVEYLLKTRFEGYKRTNALLENIKEEEK